MADTIPESCRGPRTALVIAWLSIMASNSLSYGRLRDLAARVGRAVRAAGVEPGDRVLLWAPNSVEWAVAGLGALVAGAVLVPMNTRARGPEASEVVGRSRPVLAFVAGRFLGRDLAAELERLGGAGPLVSLGETEAGSARPLGNLLADPGAAPSAGPGRGPDPAGVSHLQFTSGATGAPKAVALRHRAMVQTTRAWVANVGLSTGDRCPVVAPFAHISGHKTGLLAAMWAGATVAPLATLDMDRLMRELAIGPRPLVQGPPTLLRSLVDRYRSDGGGPPLRAVVTGGAVVDPALIRDVHAVLLPEVIVSAYGLTEATGVCTMTRPGDAFDVVARTVGRPIAGVEVRIAGDGAETGEVLIRSEGLMAGYLYDPVATAEAVIDGWLHTGDVGVVDSDGNLCITDRLKDLVIVGGFNVVPAEVEQVLRAHPGVADAAVVGAPDRRLGEIPVAFVVAEAGCDLASVIEHAHRAVAQYKVPRHLWPVPVLPVTPSGKVDKRELRLRAAAAIETG